MSTLLIVESPGKIKKIGEYLGSDYVVMASVGHIIDLDEKSLSFDLTTFEPNYKQYENKKEVINKLYKQTNKVGKMNVLLAADEDREGEMIAWSLAKELGLTNAKRIIFNSITKKELEKAVANPKNIDMNMVKAQQARRILDRIAGYVISPILRKSMKGAESAGRVQSVVVRIVVDKEKEIEKFFSNKSDTFFTINSDILVGDYEVNTKLYNKSDKIDFDAKDEDFEDDSEETDNSEKNKPKKKKNTKIIATNNIPSKACVVFKKEEENQVIEIIKNMVKSEFKLLKMNERVRKSNPPAPFTTSTLQQSASQRLGMDAKRTMDVAQKLYEAGHITYMRTDSTAICDEEIKKIKEEVISKYGIEYYEHKEYKNKKANTQEAHECVRPTKICYDVIDGTTDEKRLYTLIWKRTIQSQMKAAEYQNITIEIEMLGRKMLVPYKLVGNLENLIFVGYMIVDNKKSTTPLSIEILKKMLIEWQSINSNEDTQKPPTRYNDASLINKMDPKNLNIGRPSTYASIIDKIISRKYVEIKDIQGKELILNKYNIEKSDPKSLNLETRSVTIGKEKRKLVPTQLGRNATEFLEKYFSKLMDYSFTANMETQLDSVAEGKIDKIKVIKPFYEYIQEQINTVIPPDVKNTNGEKNYIAPEKIGKYDAMDIMLCNGPYGKYVSCGNLKFNLKSLFTKEKKINNTTDDLEADLEAELEAEQKAEQKSKSSNVNDSNDSNDGNDSVNSYIEKNDIDEENLDLSLLSDKEILSKVIEKMELFKQGVTKEWKIGKKKYMLKNGQFGYYVEEWSTTKGKIGNFSIKFLINKIAKNNKIDIQSKEGIDKAIELISNKDIEETAEYFSKNKKNNNGKYKKK
jgi:DNA topoisomerase-1